MLGSKFNQGGERPIHLKPEDTGKKGKTDTNGKILCAHGLKELIVKISILLKVIYRFKEISIKVPMAFFTKIEQRILLWFVWNCKRPHIAKAILRKKSKARGIILPNFKLCYKDIAIKTI